MPDALIQPQGYARLNPSSRIAMAAHAVVLGSADINIVTGAPLTVGGPTVARTPTPAGVPFSFRKNGYRSTEVGPAVGTQTFVEFWVGYPGVGGVQGAGSTPSFATGSSQNQTGIYSIRGTGYGDGGNPNSWGMLTHWSDSLTNANDVLVQGKLTILVVIRRQGSLDFWHDGVLVNSVAQSPVSIPAQSLICGSFINDTFWTVSNDTLLAGRAVMEPSSDEIRAFSANPWSLFAGEEDQDEIAATAAYTLIAAGGAFALTGQPATLRVARRLNAAAGGCTLTTLAASLLAARRIVLAPGALSLAGTSANLKAARRLPAAVGPIALTVAAAKLTAARKLTAATGAFALTGGTATFVYTSAPGGQGPTYTLTGGSGAFLCAPNASRLLMARRLVVAAGAFSSAGYPASVVAARRLASAAGYFGFSGGVAVVRISRRLTASGAVLSVTGKAARLAAARRVTVSAGGFAAAGADAAMKYTAIRTGVAIDATTIPASRCVQFGGGTRLVIFGGGTRVVVFDVPSIEIASTMANAEKPYFKNGKWFVDKDPDEESYYVADVSQELADRATTITSVEVIVGGVTKLEGPSVQGSLIVVKLKGMDVTDGADNFWTARVTCANTERFDRTTWLNRVDN